jgi:hypothetical protein
MVALDSDCYIKRKKISSFNRIPKHCKPFCCTAIKISLHKLLDVHSEDIVYGGVV